MNLWQRIKNFQTNFIPQSPLIEVTLSRSALLHNLETYQRFVPGVSIAPVLKSNAYGHGLVEIASILEQGNKSFPYLVIDSLYEARVLRHAGIKSPLLIIGYFEPELLSQSRLLHLTYTITGLDQLKQIAQHLHFKQAFHLKIDTGMHRQGITIAEIPEALEILKHHQFIQLEGICSHFADSDNKDTSFTQEQIRTWNKIAAEFSAKFPTIKYLHIAASCGIPFSNQITANMARIGRGIYGLHETNETDMDLKPILEMKTIISGIKTIEAGEYAGYGLTYKATERRRIATIPVGYFEGVDRRLSNKGSVLIRGKQCPIIGRVSMNITICDVTEVPQLEVGDTAIVMSANNAAVNSIEKLAEIAGTIPRDIAVGIPSHLRRTIVP